MVEKLLYFVSGKSPLKMDLDKVIETLVEPDRLETCFKIEEVSCCLAQPGINIRIAVLVVADERELQEFYRMRRMLFDLRLILFLPDNEEETVAMAHALRPRFIAFTSSDFGIVNEIVHKIMPMESTGHVDNQNDSMHQQA